MDFKRLKMFLLIVAGFAALVGSIAVIVLYTPSYVFPTLWMIGFFYAIWKVAGDLTKQ